MKAHNVTTGDRDAHSVSSVDETDYQFTKEVVYTRDAQQHLDDVLREQLAGVVNQLSTELPCFVDNSVTILNSLVAELDEQEQQRANDVTEQGDSTKSLLTSLLRIVSPILRILHPNVSSGERLRMTS